MKNENNHEGSHGLNDISGQISESAGDDDEAATTPKLMHLRNSSRLNIKDRKSSVSKIIKHEQAN